MNNTNPFQDGSIASYVYRIEQFFKKSIFHLSKVFCKKRDIEEVAEINGFSKKDKNN